jgi:hypothetical protein
MPTIARSLQAALHTARPWQSANEQRSSVHLQRSASPPPLALLQRARMVAYARTPDAGRRTVPRGPEGPVHARAPTVCAALAWPGPACRPVSPHGLTGRPSWAIVRTGGWPMMDGCNAPARTWWHARTQQQHRARCGRPCPCKACTNSVCSVRPARNGRLQPAYRPCSSPPLQQPAPASGRAC